MLVFPLFNGVTVCLIRKCEFISEWKIHALLPLFSSFLLFFSAKNLTPSPCVPLKQNVRSGTFLCLIFLHDKINTCEEQNDPLAFISVTPLVFAWKR